jgi:hypothetical protein
VPSDIDWPNLTERELDLLARYGNTPEVVAAAQAEQARRQTENETPPTCPCGDPNCPNPGDCDAMGEDDDEPAY